MGHKHQQCLMTHANRGMLIMYPCCFISIAACWHPVFHQIRYPLNSKALIQQPHEVQSRTGNRSSFQVPQLVIYTADAELCRDLWVGKHCNCFISDSLVTPSSESPKESDGLSLVRVWPGYTCAKHVRRRPVLSKDPQFLLEFVCFLQEDLTWSSTTEFREEIIEAIVGKTELPSRSAASIHDFTPYQGTSWAAPAQRVASSTAKKGHGIRSAPPSSPQTLMGKWSPSHHHEQGRFHHLPQQCHLCCWARKAVKYTSHYWEKNAPNFAREEQTPEFMVWQLNRKACTFAFTIYLLVSMHWDFVRDLAS